jgi:hypothetical protein
MEDGLTADFWLLEAGGELGEPFQIYVDWCCCGYLVPVVDLLCKLYKCTGLHFLSFP